MAASAVAGAIYGGAAARSSDAASVAPGSSLSPRSTIAGPAASSRSRRTLSSSRFGGDDDASSIQYSSFPSAQSPAPPASTTSTVRPFPFSHDDTERSRLAYETLASSAKAYRVALGQLSTAASNFGAALETCARLKEARTQPYPPGPYSAGSGGSSTTGGGGGGGGSGSMYGSGLLNGDGGIGGGIGGVGEPSCTADVLLATSGLYYLAANQQGILAETVYRSFELPIVHELDRYRADLEAEQESYAAGMREASRDIRRLEKEGVKLRKPRQRDVVRMRSHLVAMTVALDALTARQGTHAVALLDQSRDMSGVVSQASRNLVRAELDILDSLARKGWPGGGLDVVLDGAVDLFSRNDDYYDDDDVSGGGGGGGIGGLGGLGGIGIGSLGGVGPNSSGIAASGGTDLGLGLGPKLLLLGGSSGPVSSRLDSDDDDDDLNGIIRSVRNSHGNDEDDNDDTLTISERRSRPRSQTRDNDIFPADEARRQGQELATDEKHSSPGQTDADAHAHAHAYTQSHTHTRTHSHTSTQARTRKGRADSLAVESHEYQSLDSVAASAASATKSSSSRTRSPSGNGRTYSRGYGRARPFSPQRVAVDPQKDVFTGAESSISAGAETEEAEVAKELSETKEAKDAKDTAEDVTNPSGKSPEPTAAEDEASSVPAAGDGAHEQEDAAPAEYLEGSARSDADEGVQAWRQGL